MPERTPRASDELARTVREEWGPLIALLLARFRRLDLVEDALGDAVESAARHWPAHGLPDNPAAWLHTAARRRVLDRLRAEAMARRKQPLLVTDLRADHARREEQAHQKQTALSPDAEIADDLLRLVLMCTHPALAPESASALALRLVVGISTHDIARLFVVSEATMAARITRAKKKVVGAGIPFAVPDPSALDDRLESVARTAYLAFTAGYAPSSGPDLLRTELAGEAIRLATLVDQLRPGRPVLIALIALMRLQHSRRDARVGPEQELVLLADQDRELWRHDEIARAGALLSDPGLGQPLTAQAASYLLQARIAAEHATAPKAASTRWDRVLAYYDQLLMVAPSPGARLARAVAVAETTGPRSGLAALEGIEAPGSHRLPAVRAELLVRSEQPEEARSAYDEAIALCRNEVEIAHLRTRRDRLLGVPKTPVAQHVTELADLAAHWGVSTGFVDWQGVEQPVDPDALRSILTALGVDVSSAAAVRRSLEEADLHEWRRLLPPVIVTRSGWTPTVPVCAPAGAQVRLWIELEDGGTRSAALSDGPAVARTVEGVDLEQISHELAADLPLGWHLVHAEVQDGDHSAAESVPLVVAPQRLELPEALTDGTAWGVLTQLYQVRSKSSWGVGDLGDLSTLAEWSARELGADFVLVNPLHAAQPVAPMEPSPYLPTTRRFANPLYLRVQDLPAYAWLTDTDRARVQELADQAARLNTSERIERDASWALKREALWLVFGAEGATDGLAGYVEERGSGLTDFATWQAIAEVLGSDREWPEDLADPRHRAVERFREEHAELVGFHTWLQWQLAAQLAEVQERSLAAGMRLGVVHDLAVGVHPEGADAWSLHRTLARGVSVGAPPDQFNQLGQDWSQPPWHPVRLADAGYAPYRDLIRALLVDAGGLRIDHVIGLFRLWWVPEGRPASAGAYVRYDHEAMLSILVLEAYRAGAFVVGEDMGVVPEIARETLLERGILGTSVLWFEWDGDRPMPPEKYRELCLATVTTHDLAPSEGYLQLAHVDLREQLGLLTRPVAQERAQEEQSIGRVRDLLVARGFLRKDVELATAAGREEMVVALHRLLAATPSRLRGVALSDLVGDRRIINQPGTSDEYANWRIPLADGDEQPLLLEDVAKLDLPRRMTAVLRAPEKTTRA